MALSVFGERIVQMWDLGRRLLMPLFGAVGIFSASLGSLPAAHAACGAVTCFVVIGSQQQVPQAGLLTFNSMYNYCLLYTSPSPRDGLLSRMPSSA